MGFYDEERTQPIRQCPMCLGRNSPTVATPTHTSCCPIVALLDEYENVNSPDGVNSSGGVSSPDSIMTDMASLEERDNKHLLDIFGDDGLDLFDMCGSNFENRDNALSLGFLSEDESEDSMYTFSDESCQDILS